jgi:poly(ADP-ribose) glycohydrolase ARH3
MLDASSRGLRDGFRGALLGTAVGDALGRPVKGWSAARIAREHGEVRDMLGHPRGRYTEDTQMMIAVAEWVLEDGVPDGGSFAERIQREHDPDRDYGRTTTDFLRRLRGGEGWETAAEHVFARGSFGNGAAARIAPCALAHHRDREALERVVETCAAVTHGHPLGIAGAVLQARQIALALGRRGEPLDPLSFVVELRSTARSIEFRQKLRAVEECLERRVPPSMVRDRLGANATALGSVPTALYCFLSQAESFEAAVVFAVALGGETDSIGAMTGAIAGAYHGLSAIPARWRAGIEDGPKGASFIERLADRLFEKAALRADAQPKSLFRQPER